MTFVNRPAAVPSTSPVRYGSNREQSARQNPSGDGPGRMLGAGRVMALNGGQSLKAEHPQALVVPGVSHPFQTWRFA